VKGAADHLIPQPYDATFLEPTVKKCVVSALPSMLLWQLPSPRQPEQHAAVGALPPAQPLMCF